jgi:hypothetical protein
VARCKGQPTTLESEPVYCRFSLIPRESFFPYQLAPPLTIELNNKFYRAHSPPGYVRKMDRLQRLATDAKTLSIASSSLRPIGLGSRSG